MSVLKVALDEFMTKYDLSIAEIAEISGIPECEVSLTLHGRSLVHPTYSGILRLMFAMISRYEMVKGNKE